MSRLELFIGIGFVLLFAIIGYILSPKVEYIVQNNTQYAVSVDGKSVYREVTDIDRQEAILIERK